MFTEATRGEEGCLWFDWSRSLDDPKEYVLVEAFRDDEAGAAHVGTAHFRTATQLSLPQYLAATPSDRESPRSTGHRVVRAGGDGRRVMRCWRGPAS